MTVGGITFCILLWTIHVIEGAITVAIFPSTGHVILFEVSQHSANLVDPTDDAIGAATLGMSIDETCDGIGGYHYIWLILVDETCAGGVIRLGIFPSTKACDGV